MSPRENVMTPPVNRVPPRACTGLAILLGIIITIDSRDHAWT